MGVKLEGVEQLNKDLAAFPDRIQANVKKRGLQKAAARLRTYLRRAAPRDSGELRRSIGVIKTRSKSTALVGLTTNFYYKTLEFASARGKAMHPFFEQAFDRHSADVSQMIVEETKLALAKEAGKIYARNNRKGSR